MMNNDIKQIFDQKHLFITSINIGNNIEQYLIWSIKFDAPLGFIFVRFRSNQENRLIGEVLDWYVLPWARRNGIATSLYNHVSQYAYTLYTANGSDDGGKDLLTKLGFTCDDKGLWIKKCC